MRFIATSHASSSEFTITLVHDLSWKSKMMVSESCLQVEVAAAEIMVDVLKSLLRTIIAPDLPGCRPIGIYSPLLAPLCHCQCSSTAYPCSNEHSPQVGQQKLVLKLQPRWDSILLFEKETVSLHIWALWCHDVSRAFVVA